MGTVIQLRPLNFLDSRRARRESQGIQLRVEAIRDTVGETFPHAPQHIRDVGIRAAEKIITDGGGFIEAMEAAELEIDVLCPKQTAAIEQVRIREEETRNLKRMLTFQQKQTLVRELRMHVATREIRRIMAGKEELEIETALTRAQRVINSFGVASLAITMAVEGTDVA